VPALEGVSVTQYRFATAGYSIKAPVDQARIESPGESVLNCDGVEALSAERGNGLLVFPFLVSGLY
jgi:hypothetical protein